MTALTLMKCIEVNYKQTSRNIQVYWWHTQGITATSSKEVKGKLSRESTADTFAKRESILQICQNRFPDCLKDKLIRRQTWHGGQTPSNKLATDIIALMKYYTSGEIPVEFNKIFKKSTAMLSSQGRFWSISLRFDDWGVGFET